MCGHRKPEWRTMEDTLNVSLWSQREEGREGGSPKQPRKKSHWKAAWNQLSLFNIMLQSITLDHQFHHQFQFEQSISTICSIWAINFTTLSLNDCWLIHWLSVYFSEDPTLRMKSSSWPITYVLNIPQVALSCKDSLQHVSVKSLKTNTIY